MQEHQRCKNFRTRPEVEYRSANQNKIKGFQFCNANKLLIWFHLNILKLQARIAFKLRLSNYRMKNKWKQRFHNILNFCKSRPYLFSRSSSRIARKHSITTRAITWSCTSRGSGMFLGFSFFFCILTRILLHGCRFGKQWLEENAELQIRNEKDLLYVLFEAHPYMRYISADFLGPFWFCHQNSNFGNGRSVR